jgi:hypothetical protein
MSSEQTTNDDDVKPNNDSGSEPITIRVRDQVCVYDMMKDLMFR